MMKIYKQFDYKLSGVALATVMLMSGSSFAQSETASSDNNQIPSAAFVQLADNNNTNKKPRAAQRPANRAAAATRRVQRAAPAKRQTKRAVPAKQQTQRVTPLRKNVTTTPVIRQPRTKTVTKPVNPPAVPTTNPRTGKPVINNTKPVAPGTKPRTPPTPIVAPGKVPTKPGTQPVPIVAPGKVTTKPGTPPAPIVAPGTVIRPKAGQGNVYNRNNINNSKTINNTFINNGNNKTYIQQINVNQKVYNNKFNNLNQNRFNRYRVLYRDRNYVRLYDPWYRRGFFGGYRYPIVPFFAIATFFTYPAVHWFFADEPLKADYYKNYYPGQPVPSSSCLTAFPYKHVYFPSTSLKDLLVNVSALSTDLRCNFRTDMINMTSQLKKLTGSYYSVDFNYHDNDIVINFYQNLQNKAIVVAGVLNQGNMNVAFEALLDLQKPSNSILFAPNSAVAPTDDQTQLLNQINDRIKSLGGDPMAASKSAPSSNQQ